MQAAELVDWLRDPRSGTRPRRPFKTVHAALSLLRSAEFLTVDLTESVQGRHIRSYVTDRRLGVRRRMYAKSVLRVPRAGQAAFAGRAMQATRTNMRRAGDRGLSCCEVSPADAGHGQRVFRLFDDRDVDIGGLSVTVDRTWALIDDLASDDPFGFYLLHGHVVVELQRLGVRHLLINAENPPLLRPGLLYMQARLGYEVVNLQLPDGSLV